MNDSPLLFPFSAVIGQTDFKLALLLNLINPHISGVLISGSRGSAKSTLARALTPLLTQSGRFITLPLGASEEMLIGSIDLQKIVDKQTVAFNKGLLAKAHQGILYVDEVNLLADQLVDTLLDVATSHRNIIERDGISHQHDAHFVLIGTMNPDEGELRPQLQDRFGLCVELDGHYTLDERVNIVKNREAFDQNPKRFIQHYAQQEAHLKQQIQQAKSRLATIQCDDSIRLQIATRCQQANVDGMRADIVWYQAALASAAWNQRTTITLMDIDQVEPFVLAHRKQANKETPPPQSPPSAFSRPETSKTHHPSSTQGDTWGAMPPQSMMTEVLEQPMQPIPFSPLTKKKRLLNPY